MTREDSRRRRFPHGLIVGSVVWGESHIRSFLDFTLPSLLSPANLLAIASRMPIGLHLVSDKEGLGHLMNASLIGMCKKTMPVATTQFVG